MSKKQLIHQQWIEPKRKGFRLHKYILRDSISDLCIWKKSHAYEKNQMDM